MEADQRVHRAKSCTQPRAHARSRPHEQAAPRRRQAAPVVARQLHRRSARASLDHSEQTCLQRREPRPNLPTHGGSGRARVAKPAPRRTRLLPSHHAEPEDLPGRDGRRHPRCAALGRHRREAHGRDRRTLLRPLHLPADADAAAGCGAGPAQGAQSRSKLATRAHAPCAGSRLSSCSRSAARCARRGPRGRAPPRARPPRTPTATAAAAPPPAPARPTREAIAAAVVPARATAPPSSARCSRRSASSCRPARPRRRAAFVVLVTRGLEDLALAHVAAALAPRPSASPRARSARARAAPGRPWADDAASRRDVEQEAGGGALVRAWRRGPGFPAVRAVGLPLRRRRARHVGRGPRGLRQLRALLLAGERRGRGVARPRGPRPKAPPKAPPAAAAAAPALAARPPSFGGERWWRRGRHGVDAADAASISGGGGGRGGSGTWTVGGRASTSISFGHLVAAVQQRASASRPPARGARAAAAAEASASRTSPPRRGPSSTRARTRRRSSCGCGRRPRGACSCSRTRPAPPRAARGRRRAALDAGPTLCDDDGDAPELRPQRRRRRRARPVRRRPGTIAAVAAARARRARRELGPLAVRDRGRARQRGRARRGRAVGAARARARVGRGRARAATRHEQARRLGARDRDRPPVRPPLPRRASTPSSHACPRWARVLAPGGRAAVLCGTGGASRRRDARGRRCASCRRAGITHDGTDAVPTVTVVAYSSGLSEQRALRHRLDAAVVPGATYDLQIEVLRNDLASSDEKVTAIRVDGVNRARVQPGRRRLRLHLLRLRKRHPRREPRRDGPHQHDGV